MTGKKCSERERKAPLEPTDFSDWMTGIKNLRRFLGALSTYICMYLDKILLHLKSSRYECISLNDLQALPLTPNNGHIAAPCLSFFLFFVSYIHMKDAENECLLESMTLRRKVSGGSREQMKFFPISKSIMIFFSLYLSLSLFFSLSLLSVVCVSFSVFLVLLFVWLTYSQAETIFQVLFSRPTKWRSETKLWWISFEN